MRATRHVCFVYRSGRGESLWKMDFCVEQVALSELRPYENNPRLNDGAVASLVESIREFGFRVPLVITPDREIVCGHTRWKAAQKLRMQTVPCHVAVDLTPEKIRAYRLVDNRTAELAEWDDDRLLQELLAVEPTFSKIDEWFAQELMQKKKPEAAGNDPDDAPALPEVAESKPGEIYELGRHRLVCGDSTDPAVIRRLLGGLRARMCFTDPPYNMAYKSKVLGGIKNDALAEADFTRLVLSSLNNMRAGLQPGGAYYVCMGQAAYAQVAQQMRRIGLDHRLLIWCKESMGLGSQEYRPRFELILFGNVKGGPEERVWNGGRKESDLWEGMDFTRGVWAREDGEGMVIEVEGAQGSRQIVLERRSAGMVVEFEGGADDLWRFSREPGGEYVHPTQKPVALVEKALQMSSNEGDLVLDLFGGSGTTLVAAERTGRTAFLCELDPRYCDVIRKRFSGQQA